MLKGKRILLGITGGIAAYKAAMLARLLVRAGADVRVAMTEAATRFVTPVTFQALSNQPVWSDLWDQRVPDAMGHIELSRDRELIVVAPASADFMAKVAHGLADDLLSTLCVARRCPLMLAPAMNVEMWENAATQRNLEVLRDDGVLIEGPVAGDQACGETGYGRMLEPAQIAAEIEAFFAPKRLAGKRVLVTAGPTPRATDSAPGAYEPRAREKGHTGGPAPPGGSAAHTPPRAPAAAQPPSGVRRIDVRTAEEMFAAVKKALKGCDVFLSVAAVADYRVKNRAAQKMKKGSG